MSEFSRETLLNIIETDHVQCGEASALARMALAAMDSEQVEMPLDYLQGHKDGLEWAAQLAESNHPETGYWLYDDPIELAKAIRKGPDMPPVQPVPEYPETLPCPVLLEPGLRFGKGIKTSTMLAALARRAVHESDMAALSTEERAEFQARIENFKALIAQPVPVVPKSISVRDAISALESEDAVTTIGQAYKMGWNACRAAMLEAAPQSPGSEPATVPGTWIPVSEKMPPSRHEVLVGSWWGEKSRWCCKWATYIPGHPDAQSSGWLIPGASWTPTHWMPLPTAPQEPKP
ncbi:TPA: DUF551 domain-containing protein [Klebsiella quasipneumoniae]|uniref:DUF551 domain-containing protein n=1 Tax=Klebsiella quasipneumoniae TaxID=1463165 RepID=UPI0018A2FE8B|nr:DUF551 domain-containing protein [Klebsiella quasipneumoniae]MBF7802972.1 DUF551 domain-containing protein [Klebsiella quasipneumoniae]HBW0848202.1 DUF551 domain-containing protein [Klebsiella quasipneumoniae]HCA6936457.1 DUF551 domain-containing protein [Klebsiella quasipneumoniae]HEN7150757.1 DUF551 domain-containing protein [Klebsiella quasipneumoniae]